jgi:predicted nucleotidyltransferase component of viral defense system
MESEERKIIHEYGDSLEGSIYVYPLEEIIAEKIRALLQFAKKLHERGWGRSRVRDYYDLWKIMHSYSNELRLDILPNLVQKKCSHKGINFGGIEDIFQDKLLLNMEKEWEPWLLDIVPDLPSKDTVIADLRKSLIPLF